jgi:succinyl-diaminopimelate desuccinylase
MDTISLTKQLLSFNTINPPGNEEEIARFVGALLANHGFSTDYHRFDKGRLHLISEKGLSPDKAPIIMSGHFDTVPLGNKTWEHDPFAGNVSDGKIWGRGSSDMKGGLAAMILAAIKSFEESPPEGGIRLIFTAGEELGCQGVQQLFKTMGDPGRASAIIVGEPTSNIPAIGHKGGLYLNAVTKGLTAHSSMPELGDNAIYKAAKSILHLKDFNFETEKDSLLGYPTINIGKMSGGMNLNSVPDHAEFSIDIRSTSKSDHNKILSKLKDEIGDTTSIETLVNLGSVSTDEKSPFIQLVYNVCGVNREDKQYPKALPYLTEASVLQRIFKAPTVILGPGQPEMAHQTDEYCYTSKLEQALNLYKDIIINWRN